MRVDEGRQGPNLLAVKKASYDVRSREEGEEPILHCDPGCEPYDSTGSRDTRSTEEKY